LFEAKKEKTNRAAIQGIARQALVHRASRTARAVSPKLQKLRKRLRNDYPYRQLFDIPEEVLDLTEPTSAKPHRSGSRKAGRPRREIFAEADQLQRDGTN
jgi:hypothetical protein